MKTIKVWLNDGPDSRRSVDAELVRENSLTIRVRLPDGNVVKRNKARDIVKEVADEIRGESK